MTAAIDGVASRRVPERPANANDPKRDALMRGSQHTGGRNLPKGIEEVVRAEIEALHEFFVGWFSGALPRSEFETGFLSRFDPDFLLVPPAGTLLTLGQLAEGVESAHATNPEFRIAIRNVTVRRELDGSVLATYEEWQRNALASTPPENARIATVLFRDTRPLRWLHVHETWMPAAVARAGPYDF